MNLNFKSYEKLPENLWKLEKWAILNFKYYLMQPQISVPTKPFLHFSKQTLVTQNFWFSVSIIDIVTVEDLKFNFSNWKVICTSTCKKWIDENINTLKKTFSVRADSVLEIKLLKCVCIFF